MSTTSSNEPSSRALTALLTFSMLTIVLAVYALYWILARIELHKTLSLPDKLELEEHDENEDDDTIHYESKNDDNDDNDHDDDASRKSSNNSPSKTNRAMKNGNSGNGASSLSVNNNSTIRRRRLDTFTKIIILGTCVVLTLLTWLLLVRSNANVLISWLGMICITVILLKSYIVEEITASGGGGSGNGRPQRRVDRLSAIITILLFLTMALHLASYANTQVAHGVIYQGKARIVGYDYSNYEADAVDGSSGGRGQANANPDTVVTRTDLQVAWGGTWGCPNHASTQCQALVQGALCEADTPENRRMQRRRNLEQQEQQRKKQSQPQEKEYTSGSPNNNSVFLRNEKRRSLARHRQRRLDGDNSNNNADQKQQQADNKNEADEEEAEVAEEEEQVVEAEKQVQEEEETVEEEKEQVKEEEEQVEQEKESVEEDEEYVDEEYEEVVEDAYYVAGEQAVVEEEQSVVEEEEKDDRDEIIEDEEELVEEEKENEELEEENEELEEEVEAYVEYTAELEEDYQYYYDDDVYEDSYWDEQDWGSVWGEYACADLFETDVSGQVYNSETPPGTDSWPFVNIYGNCQTCEAFVVDYYSTQHFQEIVQYKVSGRNYGLAALLSLCITLMLYIKHLMSPTEEKEIELLSSEGGGRSSKMGDDFMRGTLA